MIGLRRRRIRNLAWALVVGVCGCQSSPDSPVEGHRPVPTNAVSPDPPNIVLICIDGLRQDRTTMGGNPNRPTPNLEHFATEALSFPWHFSQSNESLLSHAAMFTGRYPSEISVMDYTRFLVDEGETILPEVLQLYGYQTGGFIAGGHIKAIFGFDQGFDVFEEVEDFGSLQETTVAAMKWIEETDGPFFAFVQGYDTHRPYQHHGIFNHPFGRDYNGIAERLVRNRNQTERIFDGVFYPNMEIERIRHAVGERMMDPSVYQAPVAHLMASSGTPIPLKTEDIEHIRDHYDSGVLSADVYTGMFLEALAATDHWDNTLVVITSDHGEDLQTHGRSNHRAVIFDSTTRVPLMIGGGALDDRYRGQQDPGLAGAIDLVPTLCSVAGAVTPAVSRGVDLLEEDRDDPGTCFQEGVLGQVSVRTRTHRMVFDGGRLDDPQYEVALTDPPAGTLTLYHSMVDPDEAVDIGASEPELFDELHRELVNWRVALLKSRDEGAEPPEEIREMLKERGYW